MSGRKTKSKGRMASVGPGDWFGALFIAYSVMILSAHSTSDTKIAGLPNLAP